MVVSTNGRSNSKAASETARGTLALQVLSCLAVVLAGNSVRNRLMTCRESNEAHLVDPPCFFVLLWLWNLSNRSYTRWPALIHWGHPAATKKKNRQSQKQKHICQCLGMGVTDFFRSVCSKVAAIARRPPLHWRSFQRSLSFFICADEH